MNDGDIGDDDIGDDDIVDDNIGDDDIVDDNIGDDDTADDVAKPFLSLFLLKLKSGYGIFELSTPNKADPKTARPTWLVEKTENWEWTLQLHSNGYTSVWPSSESNDLNALYL